MDTQTARLIARIAESLPKMDSDKMAFWIGLPAPDSHELKEFLAALSSPETIASYKASKRERVRREYAEVNS